MVVVVNDTTEIFIWDLWNEEVEAYLILFFSGEMFHEVYPCVNIFFLIRYLKW